MERRHWLRFFAIFFFAIFFARAAAALDIESGWQGDLERDLAAEINVTIHSLDAPIAVRDENIQKLVKTVHGKNAAFAQRLLIESLNSKNIQIREGIIEVLARLGDPKSVPSLVRQVRYDGSVATRVLIMRVLPVFLLYGQPKLQKEYLDNIFRDDFALTMRLKKILRQPPFRVSNHEFDPASAALRRTIQAALASQLDPIGTIIQGLDTPKDDRVAKLMLALFAPEFLGKSREAALERWKVDGHGGYVSAREEDLITIQVTATEMLAAIGAGGSPPVLAGLEHLGSFKRSPRLVVAALETVATTTDLVFWELREQNKYFAIHSGEKIPEDEMAWRKSEIAAAKALLKTAHKLGLAHLDDENKSLRAAAFLILAATHDPAVVAALRRRFRSGKEPPDMQVRIAKALGEIGGTDAVRLLADLATYQNFSERAKGQREEYRLLWTAMQALGRIARRYQPIAGVNAIEVLFGVLNNNRRVLKGAPLKKNGDPLSVADLALYQIQEVFGWKLQFQNGESTIKKWRKEYAEKIIARRQRGESNSRR